MALVLELVVLLVGNPLVMHPAHLISAQQAPQGVDNPLRSERILISSFGSRNTHYVHQFDIPQNARAILCSELHI